MNFVGYSQWDSLLSTTRFYDPLSGQLYQMVPVFQPTCLIASPTVYTHRENQDQSFEQTRNQTIHEQRNNSEIEETPEDVQPRPIRAGRLERESRVFRMATPRKYKRKPERNSLTNIGNQVLVFAYMRRRCDSIIRRHFPELS